MISPITSEFSLKIIPDNELINVAANIIEIIGKELTLDQQIARKKTKYFEERAKNEYNGA